jgi:hypothetical protein
MLSINETENIIATVISNPDYEFVRLSFKKDRKLVILDKLREVCDDFGYDPDDQDIEDLFHTLIKDLRKP